MSAVSSHGLRYNVYILVMLLFPLGLWAQEAPEDSVPDQTDPDVEWSLPLVGWSPSNPFAEEEAPPSLFNLDRGDTEVDLYILGFWNVSSTYATGVAFHPPLPGSGDRVTFPYVYPGFQTNLFEQTVDLTLSLWLYERYFFEASFADDSTMNTIAAGYYAAEDELVRELVVGNVPLAVQPYPYQYAGSPNAAAGNRPTPGAVVRLGTARTYHEFLLQLENSVARRERFVAGAAVQETRIAPQSYLRGRVFVLPDENVEALEVFVEDGDGTVLEAGGTRRFRRVEPESGEYVLVDDQGILRLTDDLTDTGTIAVWYETDAGPVGSVGAGSGAIVPLDTDLTPIDGALLPFDFASGDLFPGVNGSPAVDATGADYRLSLADGRDALVLRELGRYSPFEAASFYAAPASAVLDDERTRIRVVRAASRLATEETYTIDTIAAEGLIRVAADSDPRSRGWRYPFAARDYASATMYGPRSSPEVPAGDIEILLEYRTDTTGIVVDPDIVPGTLVVTANGVPLEGAEYDQGTGELVLPEGLDPNATIDLSYRVYQEGGGDGDLVVVNGNRWSVTDSLYLTFATGLRWTLASQGFSEELDQHPGVVTVSSGITYETDDLLVDSALAVQVSQPDTTGYMRLFGAGESTWSLTPNAEAVFPAAFPADAGVGSGIASAPLSSLNRVIAPYRDYWTIDALGNVGLQAYTSTIDAEGDASGERMGPYLARSTDEGYTGTVAVLEWDSLEPDEWTGAHLRVSADPVDLRDATAVTVRYRYLPQNDADTSGDPEFLLQLGTIAEDLDGDGVIDEGASAVDPGLRFDLADGSFRRAGQYAPALTRAHSEDGNDDGVLGAEASGAIWSGLVSTAQLRTAGWREVTFELDRDEVERLSAVRGARLIVVNGDAVDAVGAARLLVGQVTVLRTGSATVIDTGGGSVRPSFGEDPLSGAQSLESRYTEVGDRFNPDEDDQSVLRLALSGAGSEAIAVETTVPEISLDRYRTLAVYAYLAEPDPIADGSATVSFRVSPYRRADSADASWTVDAATLTGGWHEISVNLDNGEVAVDNAVIDTVSLPSDASSYLRLFTITASGIDTGTLYVDELHARDPRATAAFAGRVSLDWGVDIGAGRLSLSQDLAAQSQGFRNAETGVSGGTGDTTINRSLYTRSRAEYRLETFRVAGETSARVTGLGETGAFAHELDTPVVPGVVSLEERFRRDYDYLDPFVDRSLAIAVGSESLGSHRLEAANRVDALETEQSWDLLTTPPLPERVTFSITVGLSARDLDTVVENNDYGSDWVASSNRFIHVVDDGRMERRGSATTDLGYGDFLLTLDGAWKNESDTTGLQNNAIGWVAELPVDIGDPGRRPWRFTPRYTREYEADERRQSDRFGRDAELWSGAIGAEPVVFTAIPVLELFQDGSAPGIDLTTPEGALERRAYRSEGRLQFSRALGSRVRDLFVPSDLELLLDRRRSWEGATLDDERTWQAGITAIAINLFGTQGSRPLTERYESDEFRTSLVLTLTEQVGAMPLGHRVALENEATLFGFNEAELSLLTSFEQARTAVRGDRSASVTGEIAYTWIRPGYPGIPVFERMEEKPYYRHTESLGYEASFLEGSLDQSELTLGHDTSLIVGENGRISAFGQIGWLVDPGAYEAGSLQAIGLLLGLEGELRY